MTCLPWIRCSFIQLAISRSSARTHSVSHSSAARHAEHLQEEGEEATVCLSAEICWGGSWLSRPLLGTIFKGWSKGGKRGCGAWRRGRCMFIVNACRSCPPGGFFSSLTPGSTWLSCSHLCLIVYFHKDFVVWCTRDRGPCFSPEAGIERQRKWVDEAEKALGENDKRIFLGCLCKASWRPCWWHCWCPCQTAHTEPSSAFPKFRLQKWYVRLVSFWSPLT